MPKLKNKTSRSASKKSNNIPEIKSTTAVAILRQNVINAMSDCG